MKYKFLHIPKTGGTVIKNSLINDYKVHRNIYMPSKIDGLYFCNHDVKLSNNGQHILFLRDPIDRLISHFIFLKKHGKGYDTDNYFNSPKQQKKFINNYNNINEMAKNISSNGLYGNIAIGTERVLGGLENVKKCENNILFIGRMEHLEEDFHKMQDKLNIENHYPLDKSYNNKRPKKFDNLTKITDENKKLLRKYLNKDYEIIKYLCERGFVDKSYLNEINY